MSVLVHIRQWQKSAQHRRGLILAAMGLPLTLALFLLAQRFLSMPMAIATAVISVIALVLAGRHSSKALNDLWLIRQLDQRLAGLEDSADLLFKSHSNLSALQQLQSQRVEKHLLALSHVDLRERWPWKKIVLALVIATCFAATAIFLPKTKTAKVDTVADNLPASASVIAPIRLVEKTIGIHAPAYTGLASHSENNLQIRFPEGASLSWRLSFQPQPDAVNLVFHNGSRLNLKRNGDVWQATRTQLQSDLYRINVNNVALQDDKLYRLDAVKDQAPVLRVIQPDRNLAQVELGQDHWPLSFEAEDDYGLGIAQLRIQLAQGSGENIKFKEQTVVMAGQGRRGKKRYEQSLDLASLGLAPGDDAIIQFSISDQRLPQANITRSSNFILRWPATETVDTTGVEGMLQKAIPAYFRSQRQIIIDTEKLLAEKNKMAIAKFDARSDSIGVDQRILRLRYGQFLGEEAESPEHDEHAGERPKQSVPAATDNMEIAKEYGHVHDIPEAATLLDPATKKLLRAALNEMWQAELHLRQGQPKIALPFEYRALAFIKQVQQAERIYLARVGSELPPIDPTRRLSGDRNGLSNRVDALQAATGEEAELIKFWQSLNLLELRSANNYAPNFLAFRIWLREHPSRSTDALGLLMAMDALEKRRDCDACLTELKAQVWPLLPKPAASPQQRMLPAKCGQDYLDALQPERKP